MLIALATLLLTSTLAYEVPDGWEAAPSTSRMRMAQWSLVGADGDAVEIVIFFFGPGQGGGVEANLARWFGQFEQADGSSTKDTAKLTERKQNGVKLTIADMRGTYVASTRPGASERQNRPDHRMIAAVIEGEGGPWYLRVLGPEGAVTEWESSIDAFLASLAVR